MYDIQTLTHDESVSGDLAIWKARMIYNLTSSLPTYIPRFLFQQVHGFGNDTLHELFIKKGTNLEPGIMAIVAASIFI